MAAEAEEAERKALFLLNSVEDDVKIKALDMLRANSGGQSPVRPERRDGEQVYYNSRGEVEIETSLYIGPNDHRTARKIAYARQVIPMLPFELAWYGHREGMPEPLDWTGNPMAQRRAQVPFTLESHYDDDKDDFDFSIDEPIPRRRRRRQRQESSTPPDSPDRPSKKYARKTGTLDRVSLTPRQQLRPQPSQSWDPQDVEKDMRRHITSRLERERTEAAVGFQVPNTMGGKQRSTVESRPFRLSSVDTFSNLGTEAEEIGLTPALRAPVANMGSFQPSSTTQTPGKRVKFYAHKSSINSRLQTRGPAATKVFPPRTAAATLGSDRIDEQHPHPPAGRTDRVLTRSERSDPINPGKLQTTSRGAKKSVQSQRRKDISTPEKRQTSPEELSSEEMVYLPGFHLVEPDWNADEDDDDGRIYGHSDGRLRTTAAQSKPSRRRNRPSSSSASQSPLKKRSKKISDEVIRAALRPANQPPPKLQFSPGEVKRLGLEGVAKLEKGKVDRSFDKNAPGYSEHGRYSRYINRTDWSGPQKVKAPYPEHMTRPDSYYPEEVPKMKQPTPPPPPPPPPRPPPRPQPRPQPHPPQRQQQQTRRPTAPHRHQQQQQRQRMQRGSMAQSPPRHQPQRGSSAAYRQPREQFQIRGDGDVIADDEALPQATSEAANNNARGRPGWVSGEWMELAQKMTDNDPLNKFVKKKD